MLVGRMKEEEEVGEEGEEEGLDEDKKGALRVNNGSGS